MEKKNIGKVLISIMVLLITILAFNTNSISAEIGDTTSFKGASYRETEVVETNNLLGGVVHTKYKAESSSPYTVTGSYVGRTEAGVYYPQSVNVIEVPSTSEVKVVQWTYHMGENPVWALTSVVDMAENYEHHNPGYKVIAAINGDFFDINSEASYGSLLKTVRGVSVSDGEVLRAKDARSSDAPLTIGMKNNGKSDTYVQGGKIEFTANHFLALYDEEGNITEEIEIKYINENPATGEVAVYFSYPTGVKDEDQSYELVTIPGNNAYICENPMRIVPSEKDYLYAKGELVEATSTTELAWGDFGIVTINQDIRKKIEEAAYVRVQKNVIGDYAECDNIGGGVYTLIQDGQEPEGGIDANRHPRTMIGAREDGTIILATVDGRQKPRNMYGMSGEEESALMKHYGCVNAVNLDGGGSTTVLIRNEKGGFDVKNSPSDGGLRKDSNCYLVVMRASAFQIEETEITPSTITFNLDTSKVDFSQVEQIKCTLNGVTKVVKDGKVSFDNLTSNTLYHYAFTYDTKDKKDVVTASFGDIYSGKSSPQFGKLKIEIGQNKLIFTPEITDPDEALDYYRIFINNKRNPYLDEPIEVRYTLDGLTQIEFDILVCVDLNDGRGKIEFTQHVVYDLENPTGEIQMENYVEDYLESLNPSKSGCKKDLAAIVVTMISLSTIGVFIIKKK